jgi:pilus assembly protein Flp/PilA
LAKSSELAGYRGKYILSKFVDILIHDENGATAIEYGLIATLIVVVLIGAINLISSDLNNTFNTVANAVTPAI